MRQGENTVQIPGKSRGLLSDFEGKRVCIFITQVFEIERGR